MNIFALCQVTKQRSSEFNLTNQSSHQKNARPLMCFNAGLLIKWFIFITPSPSPPLPSLLSHIIHEKPWWIYFMHKTFRAGRDDHYLSHLEALPDKSFLEVDTPLKCSHWVREMNSSCGFIISAVRKRWPWSTGIQAHSWDTQLGQKALVLMNSRIIQVQSTMVSICWKETLVPRKTWRLDGTILSYLDFQLQKLGLWGHLSKTKWFLSECFKATRGIFHQYVN